MFDTIQEFYGVLLGFGVFVFATLIGFKGLFMILSRFLGRKNAFYHYHYHYKDRRK